MDKLWIIYSTMGESEKITIADIEMLKEAGIDPDSFTDDEIQAEFCAPGWEFVGIVVVAIIEGDALSLPLGYQMRRVG